MNMALYNPIGFLRLSSAAPRQECACSSKVLDTGPGACLSTLI